MEVSMINRNCKDCTHYNYRDDKCRLGADKDDCWDFEPQAGDLDEEDDF